MNIQKALRELWKPKPEGEKAIDTIARVARDIGFKYSRCYEIWYGRARRLDLEEINLIEDALLAKREKDKADELHKISLRLAELQSESRQARADLDRRQIDKHRQLSGARGILDFATASVKIR